MINRKVLLFTDQHTIEHAESKRKEMERDGRVCELILTERETNYDLILAHQPLRTEVLICTGEDEAQIIRQVALHLGYTQKSIRVISQTFRVFCSQCHDIQEVDRKVPFTCRKCYQLIAPSDHYSEYHLAYLAYPSFQ